MRRALGQAALAALLVVGVTQAAAAFHPPRPGPPGPQGPPGPRGERGEPAIGAIEQSISINWQNGRPSGRASDSFMAPGIGRGVVECSRDTQWVRFFPDDPGEDVEMWAVISRRHKIAVRAAARRSSDYGPDFNLGLNERNGSENFAEGTMSGLISSRGQFGESAGSAVPRPTSFRLSWHWNFQKRRQARCFVAGTVLTEGRS